jgi:hypothetical protein
MALYSQAAQKAAMCLGTNMEDLSRSIFNSPTSSGTLNRYNLTPKFFYVLSLDVSFPSPLKRLTSFLRCSLSTNLYTTFPLLSHPFNQLISLLLSHLPFTLPPIPLISYIRHPVHSNACKMEVLLAF